MQPADDRSEAGADIRSFQKLPQQAARAVSPDRLSQVKQFHRQADRAISPSHRLVEERAQQADAAAIPNDVEQRDLSSGSAILTRQRSQSLERQVLIAPCSTSGTISPTKSPPREVSSSNRGRPSDRGISSIRGAKRGGASVPPKNIFIKRDPPKKRPNIIQNSMNPEKGHKLYSNMHLRYVAEKVGRGLADAAPDVEALGGLFNPANPKEFSAVRPLVSRKVSSNVPPGGQNDRSDDEPISEDLSARDTHIATANIAGRPQWRPSDSTNAVCNFFVHKMSCSKGYLCKYKHDLDNNLPIGPLPQNFNEGRPRQYDSTGRPVWRPEDGQNSICHFWYNNGKCSKGTLCRYRHSDDISFPVSPSIDDQRRIFRGEEPAFENAIMPQPRTTSTTSIDSSDKVQETCHFWYTNGSCIKGANCQFRHSTTGDYSIALDPTKGSKRLNKKSVVCHFWYNNLQCKDGNSCLFQHTNEGDYPVQASPHNRPCLFFKRGICRDGNTCKFSHSADSQLRKPNQPIQQFNQFNSGNLGIMQQSTPPAIVNNPTSTVLPISSHSTPLASARKSVSFAVEQEEPAISPRRKSVSFDLDEPMPFVDEPEVVGTKHSVLPEASKLRTKISVDDYKKRKGIIKPVNSRAKATYFGSDASQSILIDFGEFSEDGQPWKTAFASLKEIRLDQFCLAQHFQARQNALVKTLYCQGSLTIDPNDSGASQVVGKLVNELRLRSGGILAQFPHFFVLVYASMAEWKFIESATNYHSPNELRYLIFSATEKITKLAPPKEPEILTVGRYRRHLMKKIHNLSWSRLLDSNPKHTRHHFYMFIPPCHNQTARLLFSLIKEISPEYKVYSSNTQGSWDFFVNSPSIKSGIVLIHESMICELTDLPGLWTIIHDTRGRINTFWYVVDKPLKNDVFDLPPGTKPGQLSAARLLPHGHCILLTPSFLVAEPERALQFVRWFRRKAKNAPAYLHKIVLCYKGREYLHDIGEEKLDERDDHNLRNRDNPGREAEEAALGLSWKTNEARFLLHAEIRDILMESATDHFPYVYQDDYIDENRSMVLWAPSCFPQDDEKSLISWFAGWAIMRMDRYRKFTVIGTDHTSHLKAVRKPYFSTPPHSIGGNGGSVLVLPPENGSTKPVVTLLRQRDRADCMQRLNVEPGTILAAVQGNHTGYMVVKSGDQIRIGSHVSGMMHQAKNLTTGESGHISEDIFREAGKTTYVTEDSSTEKTQNLIDAESGVSGTGVNGYIKRSPVHEIQFEPTIEWVTKRRAETGDGWEHLFVTEWRKFWETFNVKEVM